MNLQIIFILTFLKFSVSLDTEVLLVDTLRKDFFALEDQLWAYILQQNKDNSVDPGIEVLKEFNKFDGRIMKLPQDILYGMKVPKKSEAFLLFFSDVRVIHDLYEKFQRYQIDFLSPSKKDYSEYNKEITTASVVNDILHDPKNNVNKISRQINNESISLIADLIHIMSDQLACELPTQPEQQVVYNLYNLIASTELKGYVMTQFALMASRLQEEGNYTDISLKVREEYNNRLKNIYTITKPLMDLSKTSMYRCDPKNHIEGVTYEQLTRLIQGHVENEVDLNPTRSCTDTCSKYSYTSSHGCYDSDSDYCKYRKPCRGNIYNCKFYESHMETCISPSSSYRRYEYIKLNGGRVLGSENYCAAKNVYSWTRWFVHCSTCICYCDEQGALSDRYFSLRPSTADVEYNKVVTGIRFIKLDRIIHIQIQEGTLLPYGYIDQNTVRWVPINRYSIYSSGVRNGIDYHTMNYGNRQINLDILTGDQPNHIITGARFVLSAGHIQLQITVTPFNFTTGVLNTKESYAVYKRRTRQKINIYEPDIPTNSPSSEPNFASDTYLDFQATDLDKDAAQTTIPFIDIQPVYAEPAVPLKSAGIYYKGIYGYGGFIGMTANTYDYTNNFKFELPTSVSREDNENGYKVLVN